jgi:hypothetical protein
MIGMSQIKKKLYTGIAIGGGIGILGIGITIFMTINTIKSYENGTNASYNRDYTQEVLVLNSDVIQGKMITQDMVTNFRVNKKTIPTGAITNSSQAVGLIAKYNITANTPITANMLTTDILSADIREQEINTVLMPSDLEEGNYVDIRIMFANGTDYIVLPEKQVEKISGQTMWFKLNEYERSILNCAIVDSFLNKGTKLYATKYADPESQIKGSTQMGQIEKNTRGYISDLIKAELTDLTTAINTNDNTTKTQDNTTTNTTTNTTDNTTNNVTTDNKNNITNNTTTQTVEQTQTLNPAVDRIINFIIKYKNYASTLTVTKATYMPNDQVMTAMKNNPNISEEAKNKLQQEVRSNMESLIMQYETQNEDKYSGVVSGAQTSITNQESKRKELLGVTQ